jgi:hypothetical protein
VLAHELAHVFAGVFGDRWLAASRDGLHLNIGLIEGVAVAASWPGAAHTPHQLVRALRADGLQPPLARVLSTEFFAYSGSRAYAVAGSFCRFLLDTRGAPPLERVYRAGGSDEAFRAAYGVGRAELEAEWGRFLDAQPLSDEDRVLLVERLRAPSVFRKVCAHELALRRVAAERAQAAGDAPRALAELETVCVDDPDNPQHLVEVMDAARAAGRDDRAAEAARRLLAHPQATPPLVGRARALEGDLALERGDLGTARARYAEAAALPLDEPAQRLLTAKRQVADEPAPDRDLVRFLVEPMARRDTALDLYTLERLAERAPQRGLYHYLLGRQLVERRRFAEAADALDRARALGLPDARFAREALRLAGVARLRAGDPTAARAAFAALASDGAAPEGLRLEAADWLARTAAQ